MKLRLLAQLLLLVTQSPSAFAAGTVYLKDVRGRLVEVSLTEVYAKVPALGSGGQNCPNPVPLPSPVPPPLYPTGDVIAETRNSNRDGTTTYTNPKAVLGGKLLPVVNDFLRSGLELLPERVCKDLGHAGSAGYWTWQKCSATGINVAAYLPYSRWEQGNFADCNQLTSVICR